MVPVGAAGGFVVQAVRRRLMAAAAMVLLWSTTSWAGAACVVALMLPRILRWIPPILRELRYNRLTRSLAKIDLAKQAALKVVVDLIEKHEECARDIERRRDMPPAAHPAMDGDSHDRGGDDNAPGPRAVA